MQHLDLVAYDWGAGKQRLVVQLTPLDGGIIKIDTRDPRWYELFQQPIDDAGETVEPEDGARYLEAVKRRYAGSYLEAIGDHDDADCPFRTGAVVQMHRH